ERICATRELVELVDGHLLVGAERDDLLCEDVEGIPGDTCLFDLPAAHRVRDNGRLEQVGAELWEDAPLRDRMQLVPCTTSALEPPRHGLRALDLDHEIDGAHVDAELERGGRDQARDLPCLEELLDYDALLPRERAVVGASQLFACELVDAQRQPLRQPPVVDEHDRRAVRADELEDRGVDRRPDRAARALDADTPLDAAGERRHGQRGGGMELAHVLDGHDDLEVELLTNTCVDELDLPSRARDETTDLLQRTLSCRETHTLEGRVDEALEALERERKMCAP